LPILATTALAKLSLSTSGIGSTQPERAAKTGTQANNLDPEKNDANHIHALWRGMTGDFNMPLASK
jgi:hypothetical protein